MAAPALTGVEARTTRRWRVGFDLHVRQVAAADAGDALNPSCYAISALETLSVPLSVETVETVDESTVDLVLNMDASPGRRYSLHVTDVVGADTIEITTSALAGGVVGAAYTETFEASGGSGTPVWSVLSGALPDGLTLSSDGVLAGTPSATGTFSFTVQVDSAGQTDTHAFSVEVLPQVWVEPDDGDQGFWPLTEAVGNFANAGSGGSADLILSGTVTRGQPGPYGADVEVRSVAFPGDGNSNNLHTANGVLEPTTSITVSSWVWLTGWGTQFACLGYKAYHTGWASPWKTAGMQQGDSTHPDQWGGRVCIAGGDGELDVGAGAAEEYLTLNCWHHIGITYDGTTGVCSLYLDGAEIATSSAGGAYALDWGDHSNWRFGADTSNGVPYQTMQGYQADPRIADVARSAEWFAEVWESRAAHYPDPATPSPL